MMTTTRTNTKRSTSRSSTSASKGLELQVASLSPAQRKVFNILRRGSWTHPSSITRVGGQEGLRRMRELRAAGLKIEKQYFQREGVFKYRMTN